VKEKELQELQLDDRDVMNEWSPHEWRQNILNTKDTAGE
jgi:hypothetical protein